MPNDRITQQKINSNSHLLELQASDRSVDVEHQLGRQNGRYMGLCVQRQNDCFWVEVKIRVRVFLLGVLRGPGPALEVEHPLQR